VVEEPLESYPSILPIGGAGEGDDEIATLGKVRVDANDVVNEF